MGMTRKTVIRVENFGREKGLVKVDQDGEFILKRAGWERVKTGRAYFYMKPEAGRTPGKELYETFEVPTDTEIIAEAQRLHVSGEATAGSFQGWPILYKPWHEQNGKAIAARFKIGFERAWARLVTWDSIGKPQIVSSGTTEYPPSTMNF